MQDGLELAILVGCHRATADHGELPDSLPI
jgi:hypothetical protein